LIKQKVKIFVGIILSILAIIIIIFTVDLREVWKNLQNISWIIMVAVLSLYLVNMILRSIRWQMIIAQKLKTKLYLVFKSMVYGYMLNQLLPLKLGEIGRAEYLTRKSKGSRSFLLGSIAVERIFDVLIIVIFLGFSILFSETVMNNLKSNIISVILLLITFAGAVIIFFNLNIVKKFTRYLPSKFELFANHVIDNIVQALSIFNSFWKVLNVFLVSLIIWSLTCFSFFLIFKDIGITIPFYAYFFIVAAGTFGMIIPSTTANVGVYHAVSMGALMIFMVPKEQALSFAIVAHAFDFFPSVILGGIIVGHSRFIAVKSKYRGKKTL